jgi:hypothetical protein
VPSIGNSRSKVLRRENRLAELFNSTDSTDIGQQRSSTVEGSVVRDLTLPLGKGAVIRVSALDPHILPQVKHAEQGP